MLHTHMVPLGVVQYVTVQLFLLGLLVGAVYYYYRRRVFRLLFWSIALMTVSSFTSVVPWPIDYILFALGYIALGMFVDALVFAILKLLKIAAEASPFKLEEV